MKFVGKFTALALTLCLVLTMIPGAALAAPSTTVTTEADLRAAFAAGGSVTLENDIVLSTPLRLSGTLTLDLNGHSINADTTYNGYSEGSVSCNADCIIVVHYGASLTINDSVGTGSIGTGDRATIYAAVKLTDSTDAGNASLGNAKLTVNGGTLKGYYYGICGNGSRHGTEITINGGTIMGCIADDSTGIFHPQDGTLTINGGTVKGLTGIEMRAGTLNVTGGTIQATGAFVAPVANGSGSTAKGVAIAVSPHNTNKAINVEISGGTVEAAAENAKAMYVADTRTLDAGTTPALNTISVTDGVFLGEVGVDSGITIPEDPTKQKLDGRITGGKFSVAPDPTLIPPYKTAANVGNGTSGAPFTIETNLSQGSLMAYPSVLDFGTAEYGYTKPAYKTLEVKYIGSGDVSAVLSDDVKDYYDIIPVPEETETEDSGAAARMPEMKIKKFNISPKAGLNAGTYNGTVTVAMNIPSTTPGNAPTVYEVKPQVKFTVTAPSSGSSGSGISLWYNGGNSFGSSRSAVPTSVEIDGQPVSFVGDGGEFDVSCVKPGSKWVTVKWNSTSVTANFTPDANAHCTSVAIPKTGDMSIVAYAVLAAVAAAGAMLKK